MRKIAGVLIVVTFALLCAGQAAAANYNDNGNGTVTDSDTSLMWLKCAVGQNNDASCSGEAEWINWYQAVGEVNATYNPAGAKFKNVCGTLNSQKFGGHNDWRLPTKNELTTLVDKSRRPAINAVFPNTSYSYWSSTAYKHSDLLPNYVGYVNFREGNGGDILKHYEYCVRCVRDGKNVTCAEVSNPDYYDLVKKVKNNDKSVDFGALRLAYTKTRDYNPYGTDDSAKDAAFDALNKKNYAEAVRQAQAALEKNYVDPDVHLLCRIAYRETGNAEKYAFHTFVLQGLAGSLYASGDGVSPETALVVISVREEYFYLNANKLKLIKTSLFSANCHNYDKADVEHKVTGEKSIVYFNIDIPYGLLTKSFQK